MDLPNLLPNSVAISIIVLFIGFFLIPLVYSLPLSIGLLDKRKKSDGRIKMWSLFGGGAVFIPTTIGLIILQPDNISLMGIVIGALIILLIGVIEDLMKLGLVVKVIAQVISAICVVASGLKIGQVTLPLVGIIDLGLIGIVSTVIWIVLFINAIKFIDENDGVAAGVTLIGLISILVIAGENGTLYVVYYCSILIASLFGFLIYNYHPAKIKLGSSGAYFLGYSIAVVSLFGFKSAALINFFIPIILLIVFILEKVFLNRKRTRNLSKKRGNLKEVESRQKGIIGFFYVSTFALGIVSMIVFL